MIVLKADKSGEAPDVDALLKKLGNSAKAIPYYAVFKPGDEAPLHFNGVFKTPSEFLDHVANGSQTSVRESLISTNPNARVENSEFDTIETLTQPAGTP